MDERGTSPLWQLRCRLPHKGGDSPHPTSPLVGEKPRCCAAEGGSLLVKQALRP